MRDDHDRFVERRAVVLVIGPETPEAFGAYWRKHRLPFVGLPDPDHRVLKLYGQEVRIFKLGRMPAQIIIDHHSRVRFVHYGHAMTDIPPNGDLLAILDALNAEAEDIK